MSKFWVEVLIINDCVQQFSIIFKNELPARIDVNLDQEAPDLIRGQFTQIFTFIFKMWNGPLHDLKLFFLGSRLTKYKVASIERR